MIVMICEKVKFSDKRSINLKKSKEKFVKEIHILLYFMFIKKLIIFKEFVKLMIVLFKIQLDNGLNYMD